MKKHSKSGHREKGLHSILTTGLLQPRKASTIPERVTMPPPSRPPQSIATAEISEEFADLLPDPTTAALSDLHGVAVAGVEETEQSQRFLGLLEGAYRAAQDAALATAQLELKIAENGANSDQEVPDEFDADKTLGVQRKLLELRVLKDLTESFGLGTFLNQIMAVRIEALFGARPISVSTGPDGTHSFYGSDEAYLRYQTKAALRQGSGK